MPISHTGLLFQLIKSLSKAEKRNFRLYVKRIQGGEGIKFVDLFDILEKQKVYDESAVYAQFKGMSKVQFSNLKRHLYGQILSSLRQVHIPKHVHIQIREQVDFAQILYSKGLYMHSLKLLERAKTMALKSHANLLLLEIMEFEKRIESRHITRSRQQTDRIPNLIRESDERSRILFNRIQLTNLKLEMHGVYILQGHTRDEASQQELRMFRDERLPKLDYGKLSFFERIDFHQIQVWYHYVQQDYFHCYRHSKHWIDLFQANPSLRFHDPDLFMRGFHYLLTSAYNLNKPKQFKRGLAQFEAFHEAFRDRLNINSKMLSFIYRYIGRLNEALITANFEAGLQHVPRIIRRLKRYKDHLDTHRILVFKYKIAALHIGVGNFSKAIDFLNQIQDEENQFLRKDLHAYARLLSIIAHYEVGNHNLVEYLIDQTQRFLLKMEDPQKSPKAILRFFRKLIQFPENLSRENGKEKQQYLSNQLEVFLELKQDPTENRAFLYLDLSLWLQAKLKGCTIQECLLIS